MPYTDYNQVLQDLADNLREIYGSTASIKFVDMPDMISGIVAPPVTVTGGSVSNPRPWKTGLVSLIGNTSGMTDMSHMFVGVNLNNNSLDLSHFDTSNVTNMSYMFDKAKAYSIDLSSFDTSNVTDMSYMLLYFSLNQATTDLDISHFDTSKVTSMLGMFQRYGYGTDATLNVTGLDVSKVTDFRACFAESKLTELDLSGWNTSSATQMYNMVGNSYIRKIWAPSTLVATNCPTNSKPFSKGPRVACDIYTDASSSPGWGSVSANCTVHFNSTHEDYENA